MYSSPWNLWAIDGRTHPTPRTVCSRQGGRVPEDRISTLSSPGLLLYRGVLSVPASRVVRGPGFRGVETDDLPTTPLSHSLPHGPRLSRDSALRYTKDSEPPLTSLSRVVPPGPTGPSYHCPGPSQTPAATGLGTRTGSDC